MSESDVYWTFVTACKFGGKFYQALALAGLAGDPGNKRRILNSFPEMSSTYGPLTRLHREARN